MKYFFNMCITGYPPLRWVNPLVLSTNQSSSKKPPSAPDLASSFVLHPKELTRTSPLKRRGQSFEKDAINFKKKKLPSLKLAARKSLQEVTEKNGNKSYSKPSIFRCYGHCTWDLPLVTWGKLLPCDFQPLAFHEKDPSQLKSAAPWYIDGWILNMRPEQFLLLVSLASETGLGF